MKAPQIDRFMFRYHMEEYSIDEKSRKLLDRLFLLLSEIEPCGDDEKHSVWIRAERGTIEDYGDYEELLEEGEVSNREQFVENWQLDYPDEYCYYRLTTVQYREWRTVTLNGEPVIRINPDKSGWEHDISDFLEWLISEVENVLELLKRGEYNRFIREMLPYKYRTGTISAKEYWKIFPEEETKHFEKISRRECAEFKRYLDEDHADNKYKPRGRIKEMTVNKYLRICKLGYNENKMDGFEILSPLEMYKRHADDRDGGLLTISPVSPEAFDMWYDIPNNDKWKIENPSHMWEVIEGSSRTRLHLFVCKDDGGYYLALSQNPYCCPQEVARFYIALRRNNIPVHVYDGKRIEKFLSGNGKIGIIPCFDEPYEYYYQGFDDKDVGEFVNLPKENADKLIPKVTWEEIPEVKLAVGN